MSMPSTTPTDLAVNVGTAPFLKDGREPAA